MQHNNYYITTPIFYVNDVPHIGHAYTNIAADVLARYMRLAGKNVWFLTGTDEHGQKVEQSAKKQKISSLEFVDKNAAIFRNLTQLLDLSNDDFIRTTEKRHYNFVQNFWQKLIANGSIYLGNYAGWYSIRDEAYYQEDELIDGLAPTGASVEWLEEPSYFFNLAKWQDKLLQFYQKNPDFIQPASRRNEVIKFVQAGLQDLSISRTSFNWGIKVPGDEEHIIYVWLDALTNYLSAINYGNEVSELAQFWPANVHLVGKDILRFHAIYWPAFLMAAEITPPKTIIAHGWWTNQGEKISKSIGNVIDPFSLIEEFNLEAVRYFLIREITFGQDGNFTKENLIRRYNSELANKIGNLLQRVTSFVHKYLEGKIPEISADFLDKLYEEELFLKIIALKEQNHCHMQQFQINKVLDNIVDIAEQANIYIDTQAPWNLRKTNIVKMRQVLYTALEIIRYIAIMLQPFIPSAAAKILTQLNVPMESRNFTNLDRKSALMSGQALPKPEIIFPKIAN